MLTLILLVVALVLAILAAVGVNAGRVPLLATAVILVCVALLVGRLPL